MSPENAHKLIRIYMGCLILGVNTLYMLSCFLKQFALVGKGLKSSNILRQSLVPVKNHIPPDKNMCGVCDPMQDYTLRKS